MNGTVCVDGDLVLTFSLQLTSFQVEIFSQFSAITFLSSQNCILFFYQMQTLAANTDRCERTLVEITFLCWQRKCCLVNEWNCECVKDKVRFPLNYLWYHLKYCVFNERQFYGWKKCLWQLMIGLKFFCERKKSVEFNKSSI